jgi:hypothetical protein
MFKPPRPLDRAKLQLEWNVVILYEIEYERKEGRKRYKEEKSWKRKSLAYLT